MPPCLVDALSGRPLSNNSKQCLKPSGGGSKEVFHWPRLFAAHLCLHACRQVPQHGGHGPPGGKFGGDHQETLSQSGELGGCRCILEDRTCAAKRIGVISAGRVTAAASRRPLLGGYLRRSARWPNARRLSTP